MRILSRFVVCIGLVVSASALARPIQPGDVIVGSRLQGSVWGPVRGAPAPSALITGPDLSQAVPRPVRGMGPALNSFNLSLLIMPGGRIIANPGAETSPGRFNIDPVTGDRALLPGTNGDQWRSSGEMLALSSDEFLSVAADHSTPFAFSDGKLLSYRVASGQTTLVSGQNRGNGPIMYRPRTVARLDASSVLVIEFGLSGEGRLLYRIDLATGARTVVSNLGDEATYRYMSVDGVRSPTPVLIPPRGTGPTFAYPCRGITSVDGRFFVGGTANSAFVGGFLEIDPVSGDRTLLAGTAMLGTTPVVVPFGAGSDAYVPNAPTALQRYTAHTFVFTDTFGPSRVWEYDIVTRRVRLFGDLDVMFPQVGSRYEFTGLAVAPLVEGTPDFSLTVSPAEVNLCPERELPFVASAVGGAGVTYRWQWRAPALTQAWLDLTNGVNHDASGQPVLTAMDALTESLRVRRLTTTTRPLWSFAGLAVRAVATNASGTITSDFAPVRLCVADYNCSGGVSLQDLFDFLSGYFAAAAGADVNGDGAVTVQDIFDFLYAYFTGCVG